VAVAYLGLGLFFAARFSALDGRPAERTPDDIGLNAREVRNKRMPLTEVRS
jgi:hypothetical protein